ncbi:hypothetical protein EAH72_10815 [Pseudomonas caspiana]|uniref:Uncharacterized protein n=1 Tax=Pseudomonas mandelii TaxID=75612 RepID=A0A502IHG6_9PSED|nr:hypothetical protein EAH74_05660 [Pseudomonas mandelii]TPG96701.1 hypothetical protein EAH72_10815 [Pseudomonas caspiana]
MDLWRTQNPCGSEPARDEASPGNTSSGSETKKPRHSHGGAFVFQQPVTQTILSPTCRIFIPLVPPMVW